MKFCSKLYNLCFLINQISYKEQKRKINETNLGNFWNYLNPLLYMVILSIYYQNVIKHKIDDYPVFVFVGVMLANYYINGTTGAMRSLLENKELLIRTNVSFEVFVVQKIITAFKEMLCSLISLIPIMIYFSVEISYRIFVVIPLLFITTLVIWGLGEVLSIIYVFFADIDYFYSILMTFAFLVSGTFMPIEYMPYNIQKILSINPIFLSIYIGRNCLIYNLPSHWTAWVKLTVWAVLLFSLGRFLMIKNKNGIVGKM